MSSYMSDETNAGAYRLEGLCYVMVAWYADRWKFEGVDSILEPSDAAKFSSRSSYRLGVQIASKVDVFTPFVEALKSDPTMSFVYQTYESGDSRIKAASVHRTPFLQQAFYTRIGDYLYSGWYKLNHKAITEARARNRTVRSVLES